jgi:hypothetical protein
MKRIIIRASDIAILLDINISTAQKLMRTIRDVHEKQKHQSVTIREFCDYKGLPYDETFDSINGKTVPSK